MARWLWLGTLLALRCGSAEPITDAGADVERTVAQRQTAAAASWRGEMAGFFNTMRDYVTSRPGQFDAAAQAQFDASLAAYRSATRFVAPVDAGVSDRDAAVVRNTVEAIAPAYCQMYADYITTTGLTPAEPRVRCAELPPTFDWWTRQE